MSTDDYSGLTTDAVPNPKPSKNTQAFLQDSDEEAGDFEEEIKPTNINHTAFRGFPRSKKYRVPSAQATIINISNSGHIRVGNQYVYNVGEKSEKSASKVIETDAIRTLKQSKANLKSEDLLFAATHMNERWKTAIRQLNFSDGQIEQFVLDYHHLGTKEVIYQLLLTWTQSNPGDATLGNLSTILWDKDQQDAVKRLSERN